jgi:hypothetical protein
MNYYKDYNVLIRKMEKAKDRNKQSIKNRKSIYFKRLDGILKIRYGEYEKTMGIKLKESERE